MKQKIVVVNLKSKSKIKFKSTSFDSTSINLLIDSMIQEKTSKINFNKCFKSFKFEKFASKFNSISMKSCFEFVITKKTFKAKLTSTTRQKTIEREVVVVNLKSRSKIKFKSTSFNSKSIELSIVETRSTMKVKRTTYIRNHFKEIVSQMFDFEKRSQMINLFLKNLM